jgi:hypothetical protein
MPTPARPSPFARAGRLAALACATACAAAGEAPAAAGPAAPGPTAPEAAADPHVAAHIARFGGPRDPARPPDPARAGGALRLRVPERAPPDGRAVLRAEALPALLPELERNAGHLQRCWDQRAPGVTGGHISVHAQLDPNGLVVEQCLTEDTVGDPALQRCAQELFAMGRYPVVGLGPTAVTFAVQLGAGAAGAG